MTALVLSNGGLGVGTHMGVEVRVSATAEGLLTMGNVLR